MVAFFNCCSCWTLATSSNSTKKTILLPDSIQLILKRSTIKAFSSSVSFTDRPSFRSTDIFGQESSFVTVHWKFSHLATLSDPSSIIASRLCSPSVIPYHTFQFMILSTSSSSARPLNWNYLAISPCIIEFISTMTELSRPYLDAAASYMCYNLRTPLRTNFSTRGSGTKASGATVTWTEPAILFLKIVLFAAQSVLMWDFSNSFGMINLMVVEPKTKWRVQNHDKFQKTEELGISAQNDCKLLMSSHESQTTSRAKLLWLKFQGNSTLTRCWHF